jgi:tellurite resistance protein
MLIWGWRTRLKKLGDGIFYSPAAGRDCSYRLVEARRWFTLFFIPLIPLKVLGTYVECQVTKTMYDPRILQRPTNSDFTAQLAAAVREVVVAVACADDVVTTEERQRAIETVGRNVPGYDERVLDGDLARADLAPLADRLAYLAGALDEHGKEQLLIAAANIMTADGSVDDRTRSAVRDIGERLGLSAAHVHGVIDMAISTIPTV